MERLGRRWFTKKPEQIRSEHHPENPAWSADDLKGRYDVVHGMSEGYKNEARQMELHPFEFMVKRIYPDYISLLADIKAAFNQFQKDKEEGRIPEDDDSDDGAIEINALLNVEQDVIDDLNQTLAGQFTAAASGDPGLENEEGLSPCIRMLLRDFRWLETNADLESYGDRLQAHFAWMKNLVNRYLPPPQSRWVDGDLEGNGEFLKLFYEFNKLSSLDTDGYRNTDAQNRKVVENSQNILLDAFDELLISPDALETPWEDLQDPEYCPTFISQPPYDETFWEGRAFEMGARELMENLGYQEGDKLRSANGPQPEMRLESKYTEMVNAHYKAKRGGTEASLSDGDAPAAKKQALAAPSSSAAAAVMPDVSEFEFHQVQGDAPAAKNLAPLVSMISRANNDNESEYIDYFAQDENEFDPYIDPFKGEDSYGVDRIPGDDYGVDPSRGGNEYDDEDTYALEDAMNDIMNLRSEAGVDPPLPGDTSLVTPTEPLKEETVRQYRPAWAEFVRARDDIWLYIDAQYQQLLDAVDDDDDDDNSGAEEEEDGDDDDNHGYDARDPATDPAMAAFLQRVNDDMATQLELIKQARVKPHTNAARLRQWRMAAWRQRYLRSLHLALLALAGGGSGDGSTTAGGDGDYDEEFDEEYELRVEDWIEHEEAWNAADRHALARLLKTEASKQEARERIAARDANIAEWNDILEMGAYGGNEEEQAVLQRVQEMQEQLKQRQQRQQQQQQQQQPTTAPKTKTKTKASSSNNGGGNNNNNHNIQGKPAATKTKNVAAAAAAANDQQAPPPPPPPPPHRIEMWGPVLGSLTYDDADLDKPAADPRSRDVFARGGPTGWMGLPTDTVYEKLQYMIILTLWRCQMAADTGL